VQVQVNQRAVNRQAKIGAIALIITFVLLLIGLLISAQLENWARTLEPDQRGWLPIAVSYAIVFVGLAFYYVGNSRMRRYGPKHRQDARLGQLLKGLDDRYVLYAFLGAKLPDYVLVGPGGVHVLVAKPQGGEIACRDDRWTVKAGAGRKFFTALYGNPVGSPSFDAAQGVKRVEEFLAAQLPGDAERPPVGSLIVFTGDNVKLRTERCSFTATTSRELRKVVGRMKAQLNQATQAQVRQAFESRLGR
jgi:hypothetical protein